jgi:hypothetical protein|tara:strand:+ start:4084 stop:4416 length:333 start_codon:yes stop_codon:yes gene_type:complete
MARGENDDISHLNLPEVPTKVTTFIGAKGEEVKEKDAFAKIVVNGEYKTHYIKYGRGDLFDPFGADRNMHNRPYFDFRKVKENVYNYYIEYLTNRDRIFLTRARRSLMEV